MRENICNMDTSTMNKNINITSKVVYTQVNSVDDGKKLELGASVDLEYGNNEYPKLGSSITKHRQRMIDESNKILSENVSDFKRSEDPRSLSFATMSNKEGIAKSLVCTRACRLVSGPFQTPNQGEEPKFGVCSRPECSFAHSLEELQAPFCGFDGNCRFMNGKVDKNTRKKIPGTSCKFRHSSETIEEWLKRSNSKQDPLPKTSEFSRKPSVGEVVTKSEQVKIKIAPTVSLVNQWQQLKINVGSSIQSTEPTTDSLIGDSLTAPITRKTRSSRWDQKPVETKNTTDTIEKDNESEKSDESDCEKSTHTSNTRKHIIRVPSDYLATIAIKAAFDRGIYNIKVIVE